MVWPVKFHSRNGSGQSPCDRQWKDILGYAFREAIHARCHLQPVRENNYKKIRKYKNVCYCGNPSKPGRQERQLRPKLVRLTRNERMSAFGKLF